MKVISHQNLHSNNQLRNGKGGGHYTLLSAMLCLLHSVTNEEQYKKCLCNQSSCYENKPTQLQVEGSRIALLQIDTLHCQRKN